MPLQLERRRVAPMWSRRAGDTGARGWAPSSGGLGDFTIETNGSLDVKTHRTSRMLLSSPPSSNSSTIPLAEGC